MASFNERIWKNKNLKVMKDECLDCAKSFAGGGGFNEGSWNKLLVELEELHSKKVKGEKP